jgi:hypothetical protein
MESRLAPRREGIASITIASADLAIASMHDVLSLEHLSECAAINLRLCLSGTSASDQALFLDLVSPVAIRELDGVYCGVLHELSPNWVYFAAGWVCDRNSSIRAVKRSILGTASACPISCVRIEKW